ncbi:hypothetical protein SLH46_05735 [Draconibacterium sp. IB214405]|uniref:hypothetical protein n=1 Tax=Draconibacterium sp. IB214405 TaxID=3097352 RepID=UPI002A17B846|nr:hypothetical protein [Draconibacterium sp. IB214405]MDX8338673.1 hypothetical protein [Draconibacterium sp. IB214405]
MKTRNNVQKAITKSLAVIISLVLISITVNAQDFWRTVLENNSFSQIAMVMTDNSEASTASTDATATTDMSAYAKYAEVETEEALDVENWMLTENTFYSTVSVATETESALEVENWMTNESFFDGMASYFKVETEEALEVEDWMQNTDYFGVPSVNIEEETETGLELEAWMTDEKTWNI